MALGVQGVHHIGVSEPDIANVREFYIDLAGGAIIPSSMKSSD